jgi:uncharacterized protein (UPF0179 family)
VSDGELFSTQAEIFILVSPVNDAPVLIPIADAVTDAGKRWTAALRAIDVDIPEQPLSFDLLQAPMGMKVDGVGNLDWTPTAQQIGEYWVEVSTSDGVLTSSIRFRIRVEPVNTAPLLNVVADQIVNEGNIVNLSLSASDSDQPIQALTFALVSGPYGLNVSTNGMLNWKPTEAQGPSTNFVLVKVSDNGKPSMSVTNSIQILVREVNQPPVVSDLGRPIIDARKNWVLNLKANDLDIPSQPLTYRLLSGPQGLTLSAKGFLEWTPTLGQAGSHILEVAVDDGVMSVSLALTVTVQVVNTAPILNSMGTRRVSEGNLLSFQLSASDAEQPIQQLTFGLVSGPPGLTVSSNGIVDWRPSEAQGPSTNVFSVRVNDDGQPSMSHTNSIEVIVREVNQAPVMLAVTTRRVSEGNLLTFSIIASDADLPSQRLSFSVATGPVGLTVRTNGLVNWTPSENQGPSTNLVQIRVTDDGSPALSVTNLVEIIVREVNSAPALLGIEPKASLPDVDWNFQLEAIDPDFPVQKLTYRLVSGPAGLTVTTNGHVQWKPTASQLGKYSVSVTVSDGVSTTQQSFPITVATEIVPRLDIVSTSNNLIILKIRGLKGFQYLLQRSDLKSGKWVLDLNSKIISTEGFETPVEQIVNSSDNEAMFFRVNQTR